MKISKSAIKWALVVIAVVIVALVVFTFWRGKKNALPEGIASGNGRLESKLVDLAAKEPLRVKEILADEGDLLQVGQVLVRMDPATLETELAGANASVDAAEERLALAKASIVKQRSEI